MGDCGFVVDGFFENISAPQWYDFINERNNTIRGDVWFCMCGV